jgi:predicted cupin superfamily sugar epimerase
MQPAEYWIETLNLTRHPEGGYFRETYRASAVLPADHVPGGAAGPRSLATCIYFLLKAGDFSAFHRIRSDELWHFYTGLPIRIHVLHPGEHYEAISIGETENKTVETRYQAVVHAGCRFAAETIGSQGCALVGCSTAPGFDFEDFELAERDTLGRAYPKQRELINRLTRSA